MVKINGCDIELARGDSLNLRVDLGGRDLPEGTDAVFTLKKHVRSDEVLLQKRFNASDEIVSITLSPRETNLTPGVYLWDLRLQIPQENGGYEVVTPMDYAAFVVADVIGEDLGDPDDPGVHPDLPFFQQTMAEAKQTMLSLTEAVARAENVASAHAPYIGPNTNWWHWNYEAGAYVDSGVSAVGVPMGLDHVDAEKLGGKAPQYYLPAVNLLVNSDFLNPVNKRGQTVYNETDSFTIDRWTLDGSGSISILSTGVVIQPITYASLAQIVPNSDSLTGKHMTFAAKTTEYGTVVLNFVFGQGSNIADSTGSMELIHWFGNILFIRALEGTAKLTVEWAALYEGSYTVETLPPYVSTHPRVEMLKVGNPVQPKSLLDNGYFVDLVNQRGQTSYNTAGYSIDRWYLNKGTLTKTSAGIKLSAGSGMYQKLNLRTQLAGKALTAAVCLSDGTLIAQSGVSTSNGVYTEFINAALNNVLIAVYESGDGTIRFGVDATAAEATIQWAALYEGSYTVETLPPYVPKGYAAERNECQRYFFSIDTIRTFANPGESYCGINIIFPVKMRIVPTHTYVTNDGSGFTFDAVSDTCATGWGSMSTGDLKRFTASADL